MNFLPTLFAFGQGIGFKLQSLTDRYLQERGVSPLRTFALQRFALIPALLWSVFFVTPADIMRIVHTPQLLFFFAAIALLWNAQAFLASYVLNTVSTVSALSMLENLAYLPLLLMVGVYLNGDAPTVYGVAAIIALIIAFVVQPSHHEENERARFSLPLACIVGLVLLSAVLNAVNNGLSREALGMIPPTVFLGVFGVTVTALCWLWSLFLPRTPASASVLEARPFRAAAVPLLWFAASIPEVFAFAALPIYTVVSIGVVTFALDAISDLVHHRTRFDARTAAFIALVLLGIGLAVFSA